LIVYKYRFGGIVLAKTIIEIELGVTGERIPIYT